MAAQINSFRLLMRNTLQKRKKCRTGMASRTAASALSDLKNAAPAVPATRTRASTIEILNPGKNCSFEDVCMSGPLKNPAVVYFIMYRFESNRLRLAAIQRFHRCFFVVEISAEPAVCHCVARKHAEAHQHYQKSQIAWIDAQQAIRAADSADQLPGHHRQASEPDDFSGN